MTRDPAYLSMIAARDHVRSRLASLEAQLRREAETTVCSPAAHRGDSGWRKRDEAAYQASLADLRHWHRKDIGALRAKLERQQAAIRFRLIKNTPELA